ncbi:hypothetical protein [Methanobacterium congolense]|uniref:Region of a membrane-bound protein predicted to be embedded in the membrane n=1 Tax=Methanobacterium congolense TaxID=118062 RepID=A0A1D3L2C9_9EURY|nr:hypothetical protein [Methanobacterium congolense]SCG85822.1 Region of a membrane-bound protein predicted to be embedded in the membrane [Methanobacterium congolense]
MKRCTNCWTDNPDDAERCKKCGRVLGESWWRNKNYRLYWKAIGYSLVVGSIMAIVAYFLFGASNTLAYGMISIPFVTGCIATVLSYRKEADTTNSFINALAVGLIIGFAVVMGLFGFAFFSGDTAPVMMVILIPGIAVWGLFGGALGTVINAAIESGKKATITITIILIASIALIVYGAYMFNVNANYENGAYVSLCDLDLVDVIQPEADAYLNAPYNSSEERLSNLNNAKVKYESMLNITVADQPQVDEMIGNSSSSIKKEYALALNQYLHLKHDYYLEMYTGIQFEINGNTMEAQKHYQNAEALIPKIQSQNKQIEAIINKDQSFKQFIIDQRNYAKRYVDHINDKT